MCLGDRAQALQAAHCVFYGFPKLLIMARTVFAAFGLFITSTKAIEVCHSVSRSNASLEYADSVDLRNVGCQATARENRACLKGRHGAECDQDPEGRGRPTSTPHQPANARFAPSLQPNAGECRRMRGRKICEIRGLVAKAVNGAKPWAVVGVFAFPVTRFMIHPVDGPTRNH